MNLEIVNPLNLKRYSILSQTGKNLLKKYIKNALNKGGSGIKKRSKKECEKMLNMSKINCNDIKNNYKSCSLKLHPDKNDGKDQYMKKLNNSKKYCDKISNKDTEIIKNEFENILNIYNLFKDTKEKLNKKTKLSTDNDFDKLYKIINTPYVQRFLDKINKINEINKNKKFKITKKILNLTYHVMVKTQTKQGMEIENILNETKLLKGGGIISTIFTICSILSIVILLIHTYYEFEQISTLVEDSLGMQVIKDLLDSLSFKNDVKALVLKDLPEPTENMKQLVNLNPLQLFTTSNEELNTMLTLSIPKATKLVNFIKGKAQILFKMHLIDELKALFEDSKNEKLFFSKIATGELSKTCDMNNFNPELQDPTNLVKCIVQAVTLNEKETLLNPTGETACSDNSWECWARNSWNRVKKLTDRTVNLMNPTKTITHGVKQIYDKIMFVVKQSITKSNHDITLMVNRLSFDTGNRISIILYKIQRMWNNIMYASSILTGLIMKCFYERRRRIENQQYEDRLLDEGVRFTDEYFGLTEWKPYGLLEDIKR